MGPPNRPPPRSTCARRFFIADYRSLSVHVREAFATILMLALWCLLDNLAWLHFLPVAFAALIPASRMCNQRPSLWCLRRALIAVIAIGLAPLLAPLLIACSLIGFAWRYRLQLVHPLDAGVHIILAVVATTL